MLLTTGWGVPALQVGNLVPCIRSALLKGYIPTPILAPRIVGAAAQWADWHHNFALNQLPAAAAADEKLLERAAAMDDTAEIFTIDNSETALQVCLPPLYFILYVLVYIYLELSLSFFKMYN